LSVSSIFLGKSFGLQLGYERAGIRGRALQLAGGAVYVRHRLPDLIRKCLVAQQHSGRALSFL
jgi:hypothetical protein